MKRFLIAFVALALGACALPNFSLGTPAAPAPLAQTVIDDKALDAAWRSFDVTLDAIDLLRNRGIIKVGSPQAIKIADAIDRVTALLTAAEKAASAGSTTDYGKAMADAKGAFVELRIALKGS